MGNEENLVEKYLENFVIQTALCKVYYNDIFIGMANEYTIRNIQIAVKKGTVENKYKFKFEGKFHKIENGTCKIRPTFNNGFFGVSYDLAFQLM